MKWNNSKYNWSAYKCVGLIIILTIGLTNQLAASQPSVKSLLNKANVAYSEWRYSVAIYYYNRALKNQEANTSASLSNLADCYWQTRDYASAMKTYILFSKLPDFNQNQTGMHRLAELYARKGKYDEAYIWLSKIPGYEKRANAFAHKSTMDSLRGDSSIWKINILNLNSGYREFSPFVYDNTLLYASNKPRPNNAIPNDWDAANYSRLWQIPNQNIKFYRNPEVRQKIDGAIDTAKTRKIADIYEYADVKPISTSVGLIIPHAKPGTRNDSLSTLIDGTGFIDHNIATPVVDKYNHIYVSANKSHANKNNFTPVCIEEGIYNNGVIQNLKEVSFGANISTFNVMHPAVSADGKLLICTSNMNNDSYTYDLYYAKRDSVLSEWSTLTKLGNIINTAGNEVFPYISPDGYVYYSTDGLPGLGGLDLYRIPLNNLLTNNGNPEHLPRPINSKFDDFGLTQTDKSGNTIYFCSDRENLNDNIYCGNKSVINNIQLSGSVIDIQSKAPIAGATILVYEKNEDSVRIAKTDSKGVYNIMLNGKPETNTRILVVKSVHDKFISDCYNLKIDGTEKSTSINAPRTLLMSPFKVGFKWKVNNIHYDFDKWNIRADAAPILDSLVDLLNQYPISIELSSHTDCRGSFKYNENLSQHRAESAVKYLIDHGISKDRIVAKGYGEYQLINKCADGVNCTEKEHQANRRTEVKVLENKSSDNKEPWIDTNKLTDKNKVPVSSLPASIFDNCK